MNHNKKLFKNRIRTTITSKTEYIILASPCWTPGPTIPTGNTAATVALIEGWAVGGGLAIATACDFRLATPGSQLGVPIAKTLGNCLSVANVARLSAAFGPQRVKRMLLLAEMIGADEALACGYLHQLAEPSDIDAVTSALVQRLTSLAPVACRTTAAASQC